MTPNRGVFAVVRRAIGLAPSKETTLSRSSAIFCVRDGLRRRLLFGRCHFLSRTSFLKLFVKCALFLLLLFQSVDHCLFKLLLPSRSNGDGLLPDALGLVPTFEHLLIDAVTVVFRNLCERTPPLRGGGRLLTFRRFGILKRHPRGRQRAFCHVVPIDIPEERMRLARPRLPPCLHHRRMLLLEAHAADWVLREQSAYHVLGVRVHCRREGEVYVHDFANRFRLLRRSERTLPRQHLEQQHAVSPVVHHHSMASALDQLWRHVVTGSNNCVALFAVLEGLRKPKVRKQHVA
mmetsp:Transcript_31280/g.85961  ORF Transcript_31280/g.85961 Transcript_31280/m.85961 type:complete len:291 (+) Transcript_31280:108-980(+)